MNQYRDKMTNDPIRRKANNARYYENKKARLQGQTQQADQEEDSGDFWTG